MVYMFGQFCPEVKAGIDDFGGASFASKGHLRPPPARPGRPTTIDCRLPVRPSSPKCGPLFLFVLNQLKAITCVVADKSKRNAGGVHRFHGNLGALGF